MHTFSEKFQITSSMTSIISTVSAVIIEKYCPGVGHAYTYKRCSDSIVHDNASTVSAKMINVYGPGVRHVYFCEQFQKASSMTI